MDGPPASAQPADLKREMSVFGALVLTLSIATPASSVFVIVPEVIAEAGSGALWAMLAAAVIAVCVAQVYGELGSAFPLAGGEYVMVARTLGPAAGFAILGLNLFNSLFAGAVLALGVGDYLGAAVPGLAGLPVALGVVTASALLGVLNIRLNAWVTGLFVAVEIAALILLSGLGFSHAARPISAMLVHPQVLGAGGGLAPASTAAVGLAVAVAVFAYDGYGAAIYFSEELRRPSTRVARAIVWALAITVAAEVIPLIAVFMGAPDLKALLASKAVFSDFVASTGGPLMVRLISSAIALAILNAVIATVLSAARQIYATARDETWSPAVNTVLGRIHPRFHSPWAATLAAGGLTGALCFVDLKLLLIATGTGVAAIYAALCVAVLAGRRSGATAHAPCRSPLFPILPLVTLAALAGVLWADWADPSEGRPGLLVSLGVGLGFATYYAMVIRRRGVWSLRSAVAED